MYMSFKKMLEMELLLLISKCSIFYKDISSSIETSLEGQRWNACQIRIETIQHSSSLCNIFSTPKVNWRLKSDLTLTLKMQSLICVDTVYKTMSPLFSENNFWNGCFSEIQYSWFMEFASFSKVVKTCVVFIMDKTTISHHRLDWYRNTTGS